MLLGRIIGTVVATIKTPELTGVKLLIVQLLNQHRQPVGGPQVAADATQAGVGDLVFLVRASEASMALEDPFVPVDLAAIGIVDRVDLDSTLQDFTLSPGYSRFN